MKIEVNCMTLFLHFAAVDTRAVHFEYLKNWSGGLDVTWQPVRGDLTVQL